MGSGGGHGVDLTLPQQQPPLPTFFRQQRPDSPGMLHLFPALDPIHLIWVNLTIPASGGHVTQPGKSQNQVNDLPRFPSLETKDSWVRK